LKEEIKVNKIAPFVKLGKNCTIDEFVILGYLPSKIDIKKASLVIGDNAIIRSHTVIYANTKIGTKFQTGHHVLIREENIIGNNVSIGSHSIVEDGNFIGDNVRIHSNVFIPQNTRIEEGAWIGPSVVITNVLHPLCPEAKTCWKGATIGKNAKIGANVTILPDVKIGEGCLIGSGSVVTKDVPPHKVIINKDVILKDVAELKCRYDLIDKPY
jgi:acetyltransferase-like isoleucine patch superfamily enzyme